MMRAMSSPQRSNHFVDGVMKRCVIAPKRRIGFLNVMGCFCPRYSDSPAHLREGPFYASHCLIDAFVEFYEVVRSGSEIRHQSRDFLRLNFRKSLTLGGSDADVYHWVALKLSLQFHQKKDQGFLRLLYRHLPGAHETILSSPKGSDDADNGAKETQKISGLRTFRHCPQSGEPPTSHATYDGAAYRRETLTLFHTADGFPLSENSVYCAVSVPRKALPASQISGSRKLSRGAVNAAPSETAGARIAAGTGELG